LPADAIVPRERMEPFDALACEQTDRWVARVRGLLHDFDLHGAYLEIVGFESEDLSSFYFDALKDRLYSSAADAPRRRSAQSAILYIFRQVLSVLSPLLSFTAEEAWQSLSPELRGDDASVFDLTPQAGHPGNERSADLWRLLKELRQQVAANESPRDFETDAARVAVPAALLDDVAALGDGLREALVVSSVERIESGEERRVYLQPAK